ncbi:MAG: 50S ribosomal protein L1 [Candidatus Micrarchaeia archaeon]
MIEKPVLVKAVTTCLEEGKGKRKFVQSIDLAIGFTGVDFKKPDNKINLVLQLPFVPRKAKIVVYADGPVAVEAKKHADLVLNAAEITVYAKDAKLAKSLQGYTSLAVPQLMAAVGKELGKYLRGNMPSVLPPSSNVGEAIERAKRTISIKTKGKFLPAAHCIIGNEGMPAEETAENARTVLEALFKKFNEHQFKSIFVKTTMGKPVRVK